MAIGSIINLGGGGGSSLGGKGMIIVDTATMTAGDVVRVRDVFDSQNVQNKSVVTAGTPLYFEVNPYCYYKVCTVQTINDTPTEIGGMYTTIDVGQTVYVNVLDKTTLGGIQGILNAHQEGSLLAIGDEVTITVNGADWVMQVGDIDTSNHFVDCVSKHIWTTCPWNSQGEDAWYSTGEACQQADNFYSSIAQKDKQYIKLTRKKICKSQYGGPTYETLDKYVWLPKKVEVDGTSLPSDEGSQLDIFVTQANRIKTYQGNSVSWWTCDGVPAAINPRSAYNISTTGVTGYIGHINTQGLLPCFRLTADS